MFVALSCLVGVAAGVGVNILPLRPGFALGALWGISMLVLAIVFGTIGGASQSYALYGAILLGGIVGFAAGMALPGIIRSLRKLRARS